MKAVKLDQKMLIKKIMSQALTFYERLDNGFYQNNEKNKHIAAIRLRRLCQNIGDSKENNFLEKRLSWDNLGYNNANSLFSATEGNSSLLMGKTSWAATIEGCLKAIREFQYKDTNIFNNKQKQSLESIIQYLFIPIAKYARNTLLQKCSPEYLRLISENGRNDLQNSLIKRLYFLSHSVIELEFSIFSLTHETLMTNRIKQLDGTLNEEYQKFLYYLVSDGMTLFFDEYPFWARLLAVTIENWIEAIEELLSRLLNDKDEIINLFKLSNSFVVEGFDTGISDFHNGGKSVFQLTFKGSKKLVYKPKNVHLENAFSLFIDWLSLSSF